jgi:hypothetical protein
MNFLASYEASSPGHVGVHSDSASKPSHKVLINTGQSVCFGLDGVKGPAVSIRVVKSRMLAFIQARSISSFPPRTMPQRCGFDPFPPAG